MKTLGLVFVLASFVKCQEEVPGQRLPPSSIGNARAITTETCPVGAIGPTCVGCGTLLTCDGVNTEPLSAQSCSDININFISCVDELCSTTAPTDPTCTTSSYSCTGPGQFPYADNCRAFFICDAAGATPTTYQCPPSYGYNSKTGLCQLWYCQTVDCSRNLGKYVLFPFDPSVMVYCPQQGVSIKPFIYRCPDSQNMQFDLDTLKCSFKCPYQGRYADKTNCMRYYECYISGLTFQYRLMTCPTGYAYNVTSKVCTKQQTCVNESDQSERDTTVIQ